MNEDSVKKKPISSENAPAAIGPYSAALIIKDMLFVSGQIPINSNDNSIPDGIEKQTRQALYNLKSQFEAANYSLDNAVQVQVYLKNMKDYSTFNKIYAEYFNSPYPTRAVVEVAALPKDVLVEISAIGIK